MIQYLNVAEQNKPYCYISAQAQKYPTQPWSKLYTQSYTYFPDPKDTDLIESSKTKKIVINASEEPVSFSQDFYSIENSYFKTLSNFLILASDVNFLSNQSQNICYYPFHLICAAEMVQTDVDIINNNPTRKYKLSCLNGQGRYHRIENYIKLRRKPYFKDLLVKIHNHYVGPDDTPRLFVGDPLDIDQVILDEFDAIKETLPSYSNVSYDIAHDECFYNSYVNFITETTASNSVVFISEKTFKAFRSGQFPLWLSGPHTVKYLRDLGFDVFDDIIDHSYDNESNLKKRIDIIHQEIDRLMTLDLDLAWIKTLGRRLNNKQRLMSKDLLIQATAHIHEDILRLS